MVIIDDGSLKCTITDKHLKKAKVNGLIIKLKINQGHQKAMLWHQIYFKFYKLKSQNHCNGL